ncbi:MAG: hypothetical protein Q3974_07205 [Rothia sp. (in: high G+C Gram-positive bacteria)]|nr:hypothetical protein [Rothia sp. (in: high G+C Gram-positive bacteria)]
MTETFLTSDDIATRLHPVFDQQIINYGAYNLVFATGSAIYRNPDVAASQDGNQQYFLLGYRDSPDELIVAPIGLPDLTAAGTPTSIDNTNAIRAYALNANTFGIESTNGSTFILSFQPLTELKTSEGTGILNQTHDLQDFERFLMHTWLEQLKSSED